MTFFWVIFLLLYFIPARLKPPPAEAFCFCVRGFFLWSFSFRICWSFSFPPHGSCSGGFSFVPVSGSLSLLVDLGVLFVNG